MPTPPLPFPSISGANQRNRQKISAYYAVRPMRLPLVFTHVLLAAYVSSAVAEDASVQTLRGTLVPCEIDVPSTWRVLGTNKSVIAAKGDGMQIMLSSDAHVGESYTAVKIACDGARELMPDAKWTVAQPIRLAGQEWLEFTITATVGKEATTFLNYTYSGPARTFTIIGQVRTNEFPQKRDALVRYMNTFRFPKVARSSGSEP